MLWKNLRVSSGLSLIYFKIHINKGLKFFESNEEEQFVNISGIYSSLVYSFSFDIEKIKLIKIIIEKEKIKSFSIFIFKFYFLILKNNIKN